MTINKHYTNTVAAARKAYAYLRWLPMTK